MSSDYSAILKDIQLCCKCFGSPVFCIRASTMKPPSSSTPFNLEAFGLSKSRPSGSDVRLFATLRCCFLSENQACYPRVYLEYPLHKHIVGKGLGIFCDDIKSLAQLCETNIALLPVIETLAAFLLFEKYLMPPLKLINQLCIMQS